MFRGHPSPLCHLVGRLTDGIPGVGASSGKPWRCFIGGDKAGRAGQAGSPKTKAGRQWAWGRGENSYL